MKKIISVFTSLMIILVLVCSFSRVKSFTTIRLVETVKCRYKENIGYQKCCDPENAVSKDQIGSPWSLAVIHAYYDEARSLRKPLREMTIEELRNEFDMWYFELGWEYHLDDYGWSGESGAVEYYRYDPWSQECWEYTVRKHHKQVGLYDTRRAIACDTVRVEIAMLQTIHCLINYKVRKNLPNAW